MEPLIDTHCHIDAPEFDADRGDVLARAKAHEVGPLIAPAIRAQDFPALIELAHSHQVIKPCFGLHPLYLAEHRPEHLEELAGVLRAGRPLALGEIGLDFFANELSINDQQFYFQAQLKLAREFELPVVVHARAATEQVMLSLRKYNVRRGVIHSFSGSRVQAEQLIAAGFHLGFGGPISYPRARKLRELICVLPLEVLLIETDAPDQPLCGRQGVRNEPMRIREVLEVWSELRQIDSAQLTARLNANARRCFGLSEHADPHS
jgi:TatD DNase family protein